MMNLRRILPVCVFSLALLNPLPAFSQTFYQVSRITYLGDQQTDQANVMDHHDISIAYDFWSDGGRVTFGIFNHMNMPVMIDLTQSSLIVNGRSFPYFRNIAVTDFSGKGVAVAPGVAQVQGSAVTHVDQPGVFIAPNSEVMFTTYDPGIPRMDPKQGNYPIIYEHEFRDPFEFRNFLCYVIDGETKYVDDHFVVTGAQFMREKDFLSTHADILRTHGLAMYHIHEEDVSPSAGGILMLLGILTLLGVLAVQG